MRINPIRVFLEEGENITLTCHTKNLALWTFKKTALPKDIKTFHDNDEYTLYIVGANNNHLGNYQCFGYVEDLLYFESEVLITPKF